MTTVTERALFARIQRKLAAGFTPDGKECAEGLYVLHRSRPGRMEQDFGRYHITSHNSIEYSGDRDALLAWATAMHAIGHNETMASTMPKVL